VCFSWSVPRTKVLRLTTRICIQTCCLFKPSSNIQQPARNHIATHIPRTSMKTASGTHYLFLPLSTHLRSNHQYLHPHSCYIAAHTNPSISPSQHTDTHKQTQTQTHTQALTHAPTHTHTVYTQYVCTHACTHTQYKHTHSHTPHMHTHAVCTAAQHCPPRTLPDGRSVPASSCTSDSIAPTPDEKFAGDNLNLQMSWGAGANFLWYPRDPSAWQTKRFQQIILRPTKLRATC
jgi:hypothetical protein